MGGKYVYEHLLGPLDPAISFEIDAYWVKVVGVDPAEIAAKMGVRSPLLRVKDGPAVREEAMTAIGTCVMDVPAIVEAGAGHTEWTIVEPDRWDTDMVETV